MDGTAALARSQHLVQLRRYDEALHALGPALADPATRPEASRLRAQVLLGCGKSRQALAAAREAVSLDPHHEWGHRLLAMAFAQFDRRRAALASAQEAMRLSPHQVEPLYVLALTQISRHKKRDARSTITRMLELHPHDRLTHEAAGIEAESRREWDRAEHHLREALRIEPHDADLAGDLAQVLRRTGRRKEAAEVLLAAVRTEPTNKEARASLGSVGLPAAGLGGLAFVKLILPVQAVRAAPHLHPAPTAIVLGVVMTVVGGYLTARRYAGTRGLPSNIHDGLRSEHRNYALRWLGSAGILSLLLSAWAALADPAHGGSSNLAAITAAVGMLALAATHIWWSGPIPWLTRWPRRARRRE